MRDHKKTGKLSSLSERHKSYTFKPKSDSARTSYINPLAYLFPEYESCYTQADLQRRDAIILSRQVASFPERYQSLQSLWFDKKELAFQNINHWLPERLMPTDVITMHQFYAPNHEVGSSIWLPLFNLEKYLAEYLLTRNDGIDQRHLNDPMNYFFRDVKAIIREATLDSNLQNVQRVLDSLVTYMNLAVRELPSTSGDKLFVSSMVVQIRNDITPTLKGIYESETQRQQFNKLSKEVRGLIHDAEVILHFSYNDRPSVSHVLSTQAHSHHAIDTASPHRELADCAKDISSSRALVVGKGGEITPFFIEQEGRVELNQDILAICNHVSFVNGMTAEDKQQYLKAVAHLERLRLCSNKIDNIIDLFERAGHYYTVFRLKERLINFLRSLLHELGVVKASLNSVISGNDRLRHKMLERRYARQESYITKALDYLVGESTSLDHFIKNQGTRDRLIKSNFGPKGYEQTGDTIEDLMNSISRLAQTLETEKAKEDAMRFVSDLEHSLLSIETQTRKLYGDSAPKMLTSHDPDEIAAIAASTKETSQADSTSDRSYQMNQCVTGSAAKAEQIICFGDGFTVTVLAKEKSVLPKVLPMSRTETVTDTSGLGHSPLSGDHYDLSTCRQTMFNKQQAVYCEGRNTVMYFQGKPQPVERFFNEVGAQIALGAVLCKMADNTIKWLFKKPEEADGVSEDLADTFFESAYRTLAKVRSLSKDKAWALECVKDYDHELTKMRRLSVKGQLTEDAIRETQLDIRYLLSSVTTVRKGELKSRVSELITKLLTGTDLKRRDLTVLNRYYQQLSHTLTTGGAVIETHLLSRYREIVERAVLSQQSLRNIASLYYRLHQLSRQQLPVMENELLDIDKAIDRLEHLPFVGPIDFKADIESLSNRADNIWRNQPMAQLGRTPNYLSFFQQPPPSLPQLCQPPTSVPALGKPKMA